MKKKNKINLKDFSKYSSKDKFSLILILISSLAVLTFSVLGLTKILDIVSANNIVFPFLCIMFLTQGLFYYDKNKKLAVIDFLISLFILICISTIMSCQLSTSEYSYSKDNIEYKEASLLNLPITYSIEEAIDNDDYVIYSNKIYNKDMYLEFMNNYKNNKSGLLRIVQTNTNDVVIITDIRYYASKISIIVDSSRDLSNTNNYTFYEFEKLGVFTNSVGSYLYAYNGDELTEDTINDALVICMIS